MISIVAVGIVILRAKYFAAAEEENENREVSWLSAPRSSFYCMHTVFFLTFTCY